uniref:Copper/zinc superoxide dismutase n=1 Tax=Pinctada fucata TaxID=50426 RepID=A0A0N7J6H7_PINFU|nr:copper/zinc superoxide dismutase [Pinctada fucata]
MYMLTLLYGFTGTSLLLIDKVTGKRVCATIEYMAPYITAEAKFLFNVGGKVIFRQVETHRDYRTTMYSNLFKVSEENPKPKTMVWQIVKGRKNLPETMCRRLRRRPPVAHGTIKVGAHKDDAISTMHSAKLPLSKPGCIIGMYLLLRLPNTGRIVSCARIRKVVPKTAAVAFFHDGVKGRIGFNQRSEYDITDVHVSLTNLRSIASGYHVHEWPVPLKFGADENICGPSKVSGHYNPFDVDIKNSPPAGKGTEDQYELGDLSGKYGKLDNSNNFVKSFTDNNLPLFGIYSIIGRSVVIHRKDGSRWICSTIVPEGTLIRTVATFKSPVIGRIVMMQDAGDRFADTQVYVELNYANGITTSTSYHAWHVHVNEICSDFNGKSCACSSAGGHFNPYNVELQGDYKSQCNPRNPLRCELGDQSGKNGRLSIRSQNGDFSRFFFTDEHLQLTGNFGVIGKSVVIHAANSGSARLACANLVLTPKRTLIVNQWYNMTSARVRGFSRFTGDVEKHQEEQAFVKIRLQNLDRQADGFHVHEFPVDPTSNFPPCSPKAVGGHFNPFDVNIKQSPPAGTGTHDQYEVGDLSGKYGKLLTGKNFVEVSGLDNFLPVRGQLSIAGRSIVIHKSDSSRWVCGNIVESIMTSRALLMEARAMFTSGPVRGYIHLAQYRYPNGRLSDTSIVVNLNPAPGVPKSSCHNWHVHVTPVKPDGDVMNGCLSAGPHYNPFHVNVKEGYDECKFENPWRCELGDSSGKHGCYDIGGGKRFYTDVNLPLRGKYGVIGRSFVIHVANKGAARYVCANIRGRSFLQMHSKISVYKIFSKFVKSGFIFLYSYEAEFIQSLVSKVKGYLASYFNFTYRYIDDVLSINNPKFTDYLSSIYPSELEVKETTETNNSASYLDVMLSYDTGGHMNTLLYDKRDDFNSSITNFPFLSSNIPSSPAYGVFISQLIRYARASTKYTDFVLRAGRLSDKHLSQGYVCDRLTSSLRKFYGR